jgi:LPXTG-site transpeptidase (sortase) family protein
MASPSQADLVGWYELGPRPGEPSNAVVSGHVTWKGQEGVFVRLHELKPGDLIIVQSGPQPGFRYVVERIDTYQADTAPVAEIFGATPGPVLTLITCGGPYDTQRQVYRDRLIVRARAE